MVIQIYHFPLCRDADDRRYFRIDFPFVVIAAQSDADEGTAGEIGQCVSIINEPARGIWLFKIGNPLYPAPTILFLSFTIQAPT